MTIGERLKTLRELKNMTQNEIIEYLNVSQPTYSQYENDAIIPPTDILIKLAKLYDVSLDYLVGNTNIPKDKFIGIVLDKPEIMDFFVKQGINDDIVDLFDTLKNKKIEAIRQLISIAKIIDSNSNKED